MQPAPVQNLRNATGGLTATPPGDKTFLHTHSFPVTLYILEGAFTLEKIMEATNVQLNLRSEKEAKIVSTLACQIGGPAGKTSPPTWKLADSQCPCIPRYSSQSAMADRTAIAVDVRLSPRANQRSLGSRTLIGELPALLLQDLDSALIPLGWGFLRGLS